MALQLANIVLTLEELLSGDLVRHSLSYQARCMRRTLQCPSHLHERRSLDLQPFHLN